MTDTQQRAAAKTFAKNWKNRGYEKGDSQIFWVELLTTVFGVTEISQFISFEDQVHLDHTSFIDGYIEKTHVMIEQKSINKSLTAAIRQSDGSMLTPFEQAKRYSSELPYSKRPRWIVTSNFQSFYIYDMEKPGGDPEIIQLEDLEKEYYRLQFLVDEENTNLQREMEIRRLWVILYRAKNRKMIFYRFTWMKKENHIRLPGKLIMLQDGILKRHSLCRGRRYGQHLYQPIPLPRENRWQVSGNRYMTGFVSI